LYWRIRRPVRIHHQSLLKEHYRFDVIAVIAMAGDIG
jgi:hypothetical protein